MNLRRRSTRGFLVALLASTAGLLCQPAAGDAGETAVVQARIDRATAIARAQWPDSPCLYHERVQFGKLPAGVLGQADVSRCAIRLARGQTDYEFCTTLVHEIGHLAGLEHNDVDPTDIMWPAAPEVSFAPCEPDATVPPSTGYPYLRLASARRALRRQRVRGPLTCERELATEVRCRTRGRYYVVRLRDKRVRVRRVSIDDW